MADPLGNLLSRGFWAFFGYQTGKARERERDATLREREHLRHRMQLQKERVKAEAARERERIRAEALREREKLKLAIAQAHHVGEQLADAAIDAIANRIYVRLYTKLVSTVIDSNHPLFTGQKFPLRDLVGNAILARLALDTSEMVRRELRRRP